MSNHAGEHSAHTMKHLKYMEYTRAKRKEVRRRARECCFDGSHPASVKASSLYATCESAFNHHPVKKKEEKAPFPL